MQCFSGSRGGGRSGCRHAARVKIYHFPLTAKCQGDFLIHFSRTSGKRWCKSLVLVAMGLTLFPRHEVRDLLARVHPFQRWLPRQNLPFPGAARFLYSHIPPIPRAECRESIYDFSDIGYHCSMEGSRGHIMTMVNRDGYVKGENRQLS